MQILLLSANHLTTLSGVDDNSLHIGERVVWLYEEYSPEFGVVEWTGRLPQSDSSSNNLMVGVRFVSISSSNHFISYI